MNRYAFLMTAYLLFIAGKCAAQAGSLDPSFGTGGKVNTDLMGKNDLATAIAMQADGKIVVAGTGENGFNNNFAVVRYKHDGKVDSSFGTSGRVMTEVAIGSIPCHVQTVLVQPDGKILLTGFTDNSVDVDFVAIRYMPDGTLDAGFGTGGKVANTTATGYAMHGSSVLQPDGKILVCGTVMTATDADYAVVRYKSDGALDSSFNGTGIAVYSNSSVQSEMCMAIKLQPDGKIVLGGYSGTPGVFGWHFTVIRLNADGTPDLTFGVSGRQTIPIADAFDNGMSLALQPDGKIIVAGYTSTVAAPKNNFSMARFLANGSADASFGIGGKVITAIGASDDYARAVSVQMDGKIVLAGQTVASSRLDFAIVRYNSDGALDTSFNATGKVITDVSMEGRDNMANDMVIQPDGKILVAGTAAKLAGSYEYTDFALARYLPATVPTLVPLMGIDSKVYVYPNPVADDGVIEYTLPGTGMVNISIADMQGRHIATFLENEEQKAGTHTLPFTIPQQLPAGNYCIIITTPSGSASVKITR